MDAIEAEEKRDAQREIIRQSLTAIVDEIGIALTEAGLNCCCPVYLTVPYAGLSLVGIACPLDPSLDEWDRAVNIACDVIGKRIGITLCSRDLLCAASNTPMSATELTAD
jgi:hypothetical protein